MPASDESVDVLEEKKENRLKPSGDAEVRPQEAGVFEGDAPDPEDVEEVDSEFTVVTEDPEQFSEENSEENLKAEGGKVSEFADKIPGSYRFLTYLKEPEGEEPSNKTIRYEGNIEFQKLADTVYSAKWNADVKKDKKHPWVSLMILETEHGGEEVLSGGWEANDAGDNSTLSGANFCRLRPDEKTDKVLMVCQWAGTNEDAFGLEIIQGVSRIFKRGSNLDDESWDKWEDLGAEGFEKPMEGTSEDADLQGESEEDTIAMGEFLDGKLPPKKEDRIEENDYGELENEIVLVENKQNGN